MSRFITPEEAMRLLGVGRRSLYKYVQEGFLRTYRPNGQGLNAPTFFYASDVGDLIEVRGERHSFAKTTKTARLAHLTSRRNEKLLERVIDVLGLNIPSLSMKEADVLRLYVKMEDTADDVGMPSADDIFEWAKVFYAMGEEYLERIQDVTTTEEPWVAPLELARKLFEDEPRGLFREDKELEAAYGMLRAARRNLRNVAYFFIRNRYGKRAATKAIPHINRDPFDRVSRLAFHN